MAASLDLARAHFMKQVPMGRDPLVALVMFIISVCIVVLAYVFSGKKVAREDSVRGRSGDRVRLLPAVPGTPPKTH